MESQKKVTPLVKAVSSKIEGEGTGFLSNVIRYLNQTWYIVDVAGKMGIRKGQLHPDETYGTWKLWRRGEDSWDIGLSRFKDIAKID